MSDAEESPEPGSFWKATGDVLEDNGESELAEMCRNLGDTIEEAVQSDPAYADGDIDLEAPLGDGSEVFAAEAEADPSWRLETPHFLNTERGDPEAAIQIEEISDGKVWLHTSIEENDLELATLLQLEAESARSLGRVLIRSAAYAEVSGGESDGDA